MKKIYFLGLIVLGIRFQGFAQIVWSGLGADNNFSTTGNWVGGVVPTSADNVVFDGTGTKNCNLDFDIQVSNFSINSGYTGTIDALASLPVITGNFSQAAGTFISSSDLTNGGMVIAGNIVFTGGTFTHNGGVVTMAVTDVASSSISGSITFNQLDITSTGVGTGQRNFDFGTSTTSTLTLAGVNRLYAYQGSISILKSLVIQGTSSSNPTSNSGTFTFSGAGPIAITGAGAAARNKLPNLVFNTSGTITMTGHVNVQGNWTGTQGTLTVGSSTENFYGSGAAISGTAAAFDNLTIQSGASVSLPSNAEVKVGGTLTRTGALTFQSTTVLGLNGSGAQSLSGSSITLAGIHAYPGSRTITLSTPVIILDSLKIDANVTFASGGNVTLRSNSGGTGRLAQIGSGGSFTGNLNVETFIPGGSTGWANLGIRGVNGQTIASWDTYVSSSAANGIPMTCVGCANNPTVIGTGSNSFVSVQGYDETTANYTELISTSPLTPGVGQWVYVGDGTSTTNGLTLINSGTAVTSTVTIPLTSNNVGDNLVANPYASPISWTKVLAHSGQPALLATNAIYVFSADLGVTTSFNSGTSSHVGGIGDVIPGGQAFYVEAFSGSNLTFFESDKVDNSGGSNPLLRPASPNSNQIFRLRLKGTSDYDETVFRFSSEALAEHDKLDARKIFQSPGYVGYPGPYNKYTTISSKDATGFDYSINSLPLLTNDLRVPLLVKVSASGSYTINAFDFQNFSMCVTVIDKLDNSSHDLRLSPYVFTISDTTSSPRFELLLCRDEAANPTGVSKIDASSSTILISQDAQGAFVKTAFDKNTKATISVYNVIGQKLMNDILVEGTVTNTALPIDLHNQVVLIKVSTDKESITKKIVLN